MNILWLSHSTGAFGAERAMMESVRGLLSTGHSVTVALPNFGTPSPLWESLGVPLLSVPAVWWMGDRRPKVRDRLYLLFNIGAAALQLRRKLRSENFDAVVTNTVTVPSAALAARAAAVPHIWYIHEFGDRDHGLRFHFGERLSLTVIDRCSRAVIVNSRAVAEHFAPHIRGPRLNLLDYAVEIDAGELSVPEYGGFRLVIVGQVLPGKGQEDAIRAVALLAGRDIAVHLDVVGPIGGAYQESLVELTIALGVADRVHFIGPVQRPAAWFRAADVALMCSRNEAFGRVTVEAMKVGTPVIGARSGGTADLIDEGHTGLFYTPRDAEELANRIAELHADPIFLRELGEEASRRANARFNRERHTRELIRILSSAVADRGLL